jgi:hypothetical protein
MQAKMIEDLISKESRVGDHLPGSMRDSFSPNHGHLFTPNKPSEQAGIQIEEQIQNDPYFANFINLKSIEYVKE